MFRKRFRIPRRRDKAAAALYAKRYYAANKERFVLRAIARRHIKQGLVADLTAKDWSDALEHFCNACAYCGESGILQKEHIHPVAWGGGLTRLNIVPACCPCNQSKKDRALHDWYKFTPGYSDARLLRLVGWLYGDAGVQQVREQFAIAA